MDSSFVSIRHIRNELYLIASYCSLLTYSLLCPIAYPFIPDNLPFFGRSDWQIT